MRNASSLKDGLDVLINLALHWAATVDTDVILSYLREDPRQMLELESKHSPVWKDIERWSDLNKRQKLLSWLIDGIIERGFRSTRNRNITRSLTNNLNNKVPQLDERVLAKKLMPFTFAKVLDTLSDAAILWAWFIDTDLVKQDAISTKRYKDGWIKNDYVDYVFQSLYAITFDGLFQHEFTQEFVEHWRIQDSN